MRHSARAICAAVACWYSFATRASTASESVYGLEFFELGLAGIAHRLKSHPHVIQYEQFHGSVSCFRFVCTDTAESREMDTMVTEAETNFPVRHSLALLQLWGDLDAQSLISLIQRLILFWLRIERRVASKRCIVFEFSFYVPSLSRSQNTRMTSWWPFIELRRT